MNNFNSNSQLFYSTVSSINGRYAKILQFYDGQIKAMINECENYYNRKSFGEFVECTKLIRDVMSNAKFMFETLYGTVTFINNLPVIDIYPDYTVSNTIINEIRTIFIFTLSVAKPSASTNMKSNNDFYIDDALRFFKNQKSAR